MPVILSTNRLLTWAVGLFAIYWVAGFLVEPLYYSTLVSACIFVGGIMVAARAVPDAINIIKRDALGPGELAVIALALLSVGAVWSGLGNVIYAYNGRPQSWIGPMLAFGRAMMALGFFMFFLSPDATRQGVTWPRWYILLGAAVVIAIISFLVGYTVSSGESTMTDLMETTRGKLSAFAIRRA